MLLLYKGELILRTAADPQVRERAKTLLSAAALKSKREQQVPFPKDFLRKTLPAQKTSPLATMIQGGQGGEIRLRLYLTITMMATRQPHELTRQPSPRLWAEMLAVTGADPARRVSRNLRWLHEKKFIELVPRTGTLPLIRLLNPNQDGTSYERPMEAGSRYVTLPLGLWTEGLILDLSPTAVALWLVIRDVQLGKDLARYTSKFEREAYGLSPDTWTRGRKELESHNLLEVKRQPQGGEFDFERMRNTYRMTVEHVLPSAPPPPVPFEWPT